jgi:cell wall-associated NlpC family hydrolase
LDPSVYDATLAETLVQFQVWNNLPPTGEVDESTFHLICETDAQKLRLYGFKALDAFRANLLKSAWSLLNVPYIHGSSDPDIGLDSYGFVVCVARRAYQRLLPDGTVAELYKQLPKRHDEAKPGDLQFYGDGEPHHVMVVINEHQVIGAVGGNKATTDRLMALRRNAYVKIRPKHYRNGLLEHRSLSDLFGLIHRG